jgi:hypothetical protein
MKNRQWLLACRPNGAIQDSDLNFCRDRCADPRRRRSARAQPDARPRAAEFDRQGHECAGVKIGEVVRSIGAGRIMASNNPDCAIGDIVYGPPDGRTMS